MGTLVKTAECMLGDIPVRFSALDGGDIEAVLETPDGNYVARSTFRGDYSVKSPSGEDIPKGEDGVFEAPGLYLREVESRRCGGSDWGLYDSAGRMLFATEFVLASMCSSHCILTPCGLNVKSTT